MRTFINDSEPYLDDPVFGIEGKAVFCYGCKLNIPIEEWLVSSRQEDCCGDHEVMVHSNHYPIDPVWDEIIWS